MAVPVATISAWLAVTRIWLLELVGQFAKNAGVEKNPGRGIVSTSSLAERSLGRSKNSVCASPVPGGRIVTIFQAVKSVATTCWLIAEPWRLLQLPDGPMCVGISPYSSACSDCELTLNWIGSR